MKKIKKPIVTHVLNVLTIALIVESFLCAMMAVRAYARKDCINRIEETAEQVTVMMNHALDERADKLTVFADILAANSENPEPLLLTYMENFCLTQNFAAVCIRRENGTTVYYGEHPHGEATLPDFVEEVARLPYTSEVFFHGSDPADSYFYQAVPIVRGEKTIAVLYGYISLEILPTLISSSMYDGKCEFYIVDGTTGNFLMNERRGYLENLSDLAICETKLGYDQERMYEGVKNGERGEMIYRVESDGLWYYTYYMPMGINQWSMQLTVDEDTAFAAYYDVSTAMMILMVIVIVLMFIHVVALMVQNSRVNRSDRQRLHKSAYINAVQRALLNAHSNVDFVDRALKIVGEEMGAETVMLLSFSGYAITNAQYWPSTDKPQAMDMVGRNIRDDFPTIFDAIANNHSVVYDGQDPNAGITETNRAIFQALEVFNMVLVPITEPGGGLRGAIAAVNMPPEKRKPEMLECITYDFFMAITNLENHNIIKRMGSMDYLTGVKNRNSYESEIGEYTTAYGDNLWCVFVDVNGLHEVNNQRGHAAGDVMLCAVADAVKRVYGDRYTYRIGGDEFVAFVLDSSKEELIKKKKAITAELAVKGYYVSIGFTGIERNADGLFDVENAVADAEIVMYREKWKYYQEHDIPSERGHFPRNLPQNYDGSSED